VCFSCFLQNYIYIYIYILFILIFFCCYVIIVLNFLYFKRIASKASSHKNNTFNIIFITNWYKNLIISTLTMVIMLKVHTFNIDSHYKWYSKWISTSLSKPILNYVWFNIGSRINIEKLKKSILNFISQYSILRYSNTKMYYLLYKYH